MTEGPLSAVADGVSPLPDRAAQASVEAAESTPQRITTVRFFTGNVHRLVILGLAEMAVVVLAVYGAILLRFPGDSLASLERDIGPLWVRSLLVAGIVLVCIASMGLYQLRHRARFTGVLARLLVAVVAAEAALGLLFYLVPGVFVGRGVLFIAGALAFGGLAVTRYAFLRFVDQDIFKRRVLVWGCGERAAHIANRLRRRTDRRGFRILGYVPAPGDNAHVPFHQLVQSEGDLVRYALRNRVEEIVVAMDDRRAGFPEAMLRECRMRGIQVHDIVSFLERETGRVSVELARPSWLIFSDGFRCDVLRLAGKRAFDIVFSLLLLVVTSPIMLLAALAVWLEDRGPVLYRQERTGQNGKPFEILKFRSMSVNAEAGGKAIWASRNDPRVTRVGAFIRKVRIDELPQALNVLLGHMSFVGPRPERPMFVEKLARTIPYYSERHFVKPGITGWAQVRYPYGASEEDAREKLGYDLYYVKNHSLIFDLMVLLQTVEVVLFRVGSR